MPPAPLPVALPAAFALLTLALLLLWVPGVPRRLWWGCTAAAVVLARAGGLVDVTGVLLLGLLAAVCALARRDDVTGTAAGLVMTALVAGLMTHMLPGFANPRVLDGVRLAPDSVPYTKYLNFDKAMAAVLLLGVYAPEWPARDAGLRHLRPSMRRMAALVAVVTVATLALGFARWDPKLPAWWPMWVWSMVCLTAAPEETLFRGLVQRGVGAWLERRAYAEAASRDLLAVLAAGALFGVAHAAGGVCYVVLATIAGIGYGWIALRAQSLASAVGAHAGLNTVHLLLFSYPMLAGAA